MNAVPAARPMPPKVVLYTTPFCPYCLRAKELLRRKKVAFDEIDVMMDAARRDEMTRRARGKRTVPQIFVGDTHVGGCDELVALDRQGKLDALLAGTA